MITCLDPVAFTEGAAVDHSPALQQEPHHADAAIFTHVIQNRSTIFVGAIHISAVIET